MNILTQKAKLLILLATGLAFIIFYRLLLAPRFHLDSLQAAVVQIQQLGNLAWVVQGGLIVLQALVPYIPFAVLAGVSVLLFGFWKGFLLNFVSAVIGSSLMFGLIRWGAYDWVVRRLASRPFYKRYAEFLSQNGFKVVFIARLIPVLPLSFVNASAAVSPIRFGAFFGASALGKIPIVAAESAFGAGLLNWRDHLQMLVLGGFVLLLLSLLGWILRKRFKIK